MAIYDRVPCKTLHLTKFNRSHTSSFTGDMSVVYPTLVDEAIPGDVTKLGHEQVTKFMPLVSPILDDIYIDHWSMFVPNRLIYADWERFIERKSGTNNDYDKPLMSIQQIWKAWKTWQSLNTSKVSGLSLDVKSMFGNIAGLASNAKLKVGDIVYNSLEEYALSTSVHYRESVVPNFETALSVWLRAHPDLVTSCTEYYVYPFATGSLMDYLGFPVLDVSLQDYRPLFTVTVDVNGNFTITACSLDWDSDAVFNGKTYSYSDWQDLVDEWAENEYWSATPYLSYWYCYNEWFRHQEFDLKNYCLVKHIPANVSAPDITYLGVPEEDVDNPDSPEDVTLRWYPFTRVVNRDYFTSSLPTAQRGTAPALPISGMLPIKLINDDAGVSAVKSNMLGSPTEYLGFGGIGALAEPSYKSSMVSGTPGEGALGAWYYNPYGVDLASATTFDINDLRLANAIQRFQELNNVAGSRYTSFLKVQYGTAPNDDVLQRPDYFAHSSEMVHTQEVENFADNGVSPLGARAGKASSSGSGFARPYHPREHGVIINFVCVSPKQSYTSQGVERCWLRKSSFDYYNSLFAGLGEQEILKEELYFGCDSHDHEILGFNGRFDEYRVKQSNLKGLLRSSKYVSYGLSRRFFNAPSLNSDFLHYNIDKSRFLAVPSEPTFVMFYRNLLTQYRPMPEFATPSL